MHAVVYVLTTGIPWRKLPAVFGVAVPTAYRRFTEWSEIGLWRTLKSLTFDTPELHHWVHTITDAALARTPQPAPDTTPIADPEPVTDPPTDTPTHRPPHPYPAISPGHK